MACFVSLFKYSGIRNLMHICKSTYSAVVSHHWVLTKLGGKVKWECSNWNVRKSLLEGQGLTLSTGMSDFEVCLATQYCVKGYAPFLLPYVKFVGHEKL